MQSARITNLLLFNLFLGACGSAHLDNGRRYLAKGNLPVAIEILDRGVIAEPKIAELRDAAIEAHQVYERDLRQDIDRLINNRRYLLALGRLVELEDVSRRALQLSMPAEIPQRVEKERHQAVAKAVVQLEKQLDQRQGRGKPMRADLDGCRQIQALVARDSSIARICERLLAHFKLHAVLQVDKDSVSVVMDLGAFIRQRMRAKNPELIALIPAASPRQNARMIVWIGKASKDESPWYLASRKAFHRWVPKLDRTGSQIEETVVIAPSGVDAKPTKKRKKVWELISGEYRIFRSARRISLPYEVRIEDLRTSTIVVMHTASIQVDSRSSYYEYVGHPAGQTDPPPVPAQGRRGAPSLQSHRVLVSQALRRLPDQVVQATLERLE